MIARMVQECYNPAYALCHSQESHGYVVINKATGKVKSHHKTKEKALASVRATYAGLAKSGKS